MQQKYQIFILIVSNQIVCVFQQTPDKFEDTQFEAQILNYIKNQKLVTNFEYVKAKLMID
jgi:hypothetical protein